MDELDPREAGDILAQQSGETIGRALSDQSVTYQEVYDAAAFSWISSRTTFAEVFSPQNHRIVELIITP